jgi:hypothetical protein
MLRFIICLFAAGYLGFFTMACSDDGGSAGGEGAIGGTCYGNGSCDTGAMCVDGDCVSDDGDGTSDSENQANNMAGDNGSSSGNGSGDDDSTDEEDDEPFCGPGVTCCDYPYLEEGEGGAVGTPCDTDEECAFGECLLPGDGGNITNFEFGFCTRGCDCETTTQAQLSDEQKETQSCLYPSGNNGAWHHVVLKCSNVEEDCKTIDDRYTECKSPSEGGVAKVCHAGWE